MDFLELTKQRYSVRKFSEQKVESEKLNLILEAGRNAPTAVNYQPQRILILNTEDSLSKLKSCTPYHFNAALALLICYDNTVNWKRPFDGRDMGEVDTSIVATHMMIEAANIGLGSTWVGHFDPQKIKSAFALTDNIIPVAILPIGYPHNTSLPHQNHNKRFDTSVTTFYNSF